MDTNLWKRTHKKIFTAVSCVLTTAMLFGCGMEPTLKENAAKNGPAGNEAASTKDVIIIKTAHGVPTGNERHLALEFFAQALEKHTMGKVKLEIYPNGQLYQDKDVIEATMRGDIQLGVPLIAAAEAIDKRFALVGAPFAFSSTQDVFDFIQSDRGEKLSADILQQRGLKYLGYTTQGVSFIITSSKTRLDSPAGIKGQKFRTPAGPVWQEPIKVFGGSPVSIDSSELQSALQTGVVDGVYTSVLAAKSSKLYDAGQKYALAGPWGASFGLAFFNQKFWDSLPEDIKPQILEAWKDVEQYNQKTVLEHEESVLKELKEKGMTIDMLDESNPNYQAFREAWLPIRDNIMKELQPEVAKLVTKGE